MDIQLKIDKIIELLDKSIIREYNDIEWVNHYVYAKNYLMKVRTDLSMFDKVSISILYLIARVVLWTEK